MNFLENIFFDVVIGEMKAFLDENGFKGEDGIFTNDAKSLKVEYDEEKTLYKLFVADITDGNTGEYSLCSSYLFDEKSNKGDAVCVGIDFADADTQDPCPDPACSAAARRGRSAAEHDRTGDFQSPTKKH